jgi:hypothetical protein
MYRVIKTSLCTWWLQYRKLQVMFKVSPASLQTFIDTPNCVLEDRVQYSTVHIPNVFCDGHRQVHRGFLIIVRCTESFWSSSGAQRLFDHRQVHRYCVIIVRCTETFWSSCMLQRIVFLVMMTLKLKLVKFYWQRLLYSVGKTSWTLGWETLTRRTCIRLSPCGWCSMLLLCGRLHVAAEDPAQDNTKESWDHAEGAHRTDYFGHEVRRALGSRVQTWTASRLRKKHREGRFVMVKIFLAKFGSLLGKTPACVFL